MKKLFTSMLLLAALSFASAQTYDLDAEAKKPKTEQQLIGKAEKTSETAKYKGEIYPVYKSPLNKYFIVYKNRNGNWSKKYIHILN